MPRREIQDEGPPGPGAWVVTFSDCMTLLLCFFVLLMTFSSFNEEDMQQMMAVIKSYDLNYATDNTRQPKDSALPTRDRPTDPTDEGSLDETQADPKITRSPKRLPSPMDVSAFRDRRILRVPSARMFYGFGTALTDEGKTVLKLLASFVQLRACQVVIAETPAAYEGQEHSELSIRRARGIVAHLVGIGKLEPDRLSISTRAFSPHASERGRMVEFCLLNPNIYKNRGGMP